MTDHNVLLTNFLTTFFRTHKNEYEGISDDDYDKEVERITIAFNRFLKDVEKPLERKKIGRPPGMTEYISTRIPEIKRLRSEGLTHAQISKKLFISRNMISAILNNKI